MKLLCKLGWHTSQYTDSSLMNSARRCNHCGEWVNKNAGEIVDAERKSWDEFYNSRNN